MTIRSSFRALLLSGVLSSSAMLYACGGDPFQLFWSATPDTVLLYSLVRPELNLPSAYDFALRRSVEIQNPGETGQWDVVLDTEGGQLVLKLPLFYGIETDSRITVFEGMSFDQVIRAPKDTTLYIADEAVPMALGNTYVIQTHISPDRFNQRCRFYAKMEPLELDVERGTMLFVEDRNPLCEDLDLVPPETNN